MNCIALSVPVSSLYQAQLDNVTESVAEDSMCVMSREAGEKPSDRETCSLQTCPFWQTSQYSEVSTHTHTHTFGQGMVIELSISAM